MVSSHWQSRTSDLRPGIAPDVMSVDEKELDSALLKQVVTEKGRSEHTSAQKQSEVAASALPGPRLRPRCRRCELLPL